MKNYTNFLECFEKFIKDEMNCLKGGGKIFYGDLKKFRFYIFFYYNGSMKEGEDEFIKIKSVFYRKRLKVIDEVVEKAITNNAKNYFEVYEEYKKLRG